VHGRRRLGHGAQLRRLRPLSNGATTLIYEGAPDFPEKDRFWSIVERRKVSIFYTAPRPSAPSMRWGDALPKKHDMSSLRLLGTVGEPINPEGVDVVPRGHRGGRCPIVDTCGRRRRAAS